MKDLDLAILFNMLLSIYELWKCDFGSQPFIICILFVSAMDKRNQ